MSFEKLKYRLRAKGRHGTHSPFVYAFVERVLRNKETFANRPENISAKSWQRLNATLKYLAVEEIFFSKGFSNEVIEALSKNLPEIKTTVFSAGLTPAASDSLLLLCADDRITIENLLKNCLPPVHGRFSVYVLSPHRDEQTFEQLFCIKNNAAFKMVLDFWEGLLLVNSHDFKEKQFFELK